MNNGVSKRSRKTANSLVHQPPTSTTGNNGSSSSSSPSSSTTFTSEQVLQRSMERVMLVQARTLELYDKWKMQLLRLSLFVTILSMHQASRSVKTCMSDMKDHYAASSNDNNLADKDGVANTMSIHQVLSTWLSLMEEFQLEIGNILLIVLSAFFLYSNGAGDNGDGDQGETGTTINDPWIWIGHWSFSACCLLSSVLVGLFVYTPKVGCGGIAEQMFGSTTGSTIESTAAAAAVNRSRDEFPIAVIFFMIVFVAYMFMSFGMMKVNRNISTVYLLKSQMLAKNNTSSNTSRKNGTNTNPKRRQKTNRQ